MTKDLPPAPKADAFHATLAAITLELVDGAALRARHGFDAGLSGFQSCELAATPYVLESGDETTTVRLAQADVRSARLDGETVLYTRDGQEHRARFARTGNRLWLDAGFVRSYEDCTYAPALASAEAESGAVRARSDGKIVRVDVAVGDAVTLGQPLVVLESMKMEFELTAPLAGTVRALHVAVGDQTQAKRVLVEIA
jgi:biotin carboxyl carrier protein